MLLVVFLNEEIGYFPDFFISKVSYSPGPGLLSNLSNIFVPPTLE